MVDRADERVICREREAHVLDGRRSAPPPVVRCLEWKEGDEHSFDLRLLRVLDKMERREYANEVDEGFLEDDQVNLRYVNYKEYGTNHSYGGLYLGPQISLFWNLQTLIIDIWRKNCVAPYEFCEMLQLRNLEVEIGVYLPEPLPSDNLEQVMRNLQTLKRVENLKLSDEVCKRIPNIKELKLTYSDSALEFPSSDYCLHYLVCFPKLESLECLFEWNGGEWREFGVSLKLPSSLKNLCLSDSGLDWEEITMKVGYLTIEDSEDLVEWNADSTNFPVLEYLSLGTMWSLDELPSFMGEIPTLRSIHLEECRESLMISAVRIVMESQEEYGNHDLKLQIYCDRDEAVRFNKKLQEEGLTINNLHLSDHE